MNSREKYVEMEKIQNFWKNLGKYFEEYAGVTGIHGLHYLTERRTIVEKIFWIFMLLLSLSGCLVMISLIVEKYEHSPVVVSFATKDTPIYEIPFPAVTICPESKCSERNFNYSYMYKQVLHSFDRLNSPEKKYFQYISLVCNDIEQNTLLSNYRKAVEDDFYDVIDKVKPDELVSCNYMGEGNDCRKLFTPIILDEGICYSFNIMNREDMYRNHVFQYKDFHHITSAESSNYNIDSGYSKNSDVDTYPRRALMSGPDNSLRIEFLHVQYNTDFFCKKYLQGFRVLLHNPGEIPRLSKSYFRVPLDKIVTAEVVPQLLSTSDTVKGYSSEVRSCYLENERPLKYFKIYTQSNCLLECQTNYTLDLCGCVAYHMPRNSSTEICSISNSICLQEAERKLKVNELKTRISGSSEHNCDCKPSCTSLTYDMKTSEDTYYWKEYDDLMNTSAIFEDVNRVHVSLLSIYFKVDQFTGIERNELYGVSDLISNFGGLLGLFTGFSLISFAEIIYYLTLRICYNLKLFGRWWGSPS